MAPLNPKSASALAWLALVVNGLGLGMTAHSGQFMLSGFAGALALIPTVFARRGAQVFGAAVLVASLGLAVAGYPRYEQDPYLQRAKTGAGQTPPPPTRP